MKTKTQQKAKSKRIVLKQQGKKKKKKANLNNMKYFRFVKIK